MCGEKTLGARRIAETDLKSKKLFKKKSAKRFNGPLTSKVSERTRENQHI
jgi:hypothetical protein